MTDNNNNKNNEALDWDSEIEDSAQERTLLDDGEYNFTVTSFERGHFPGSVKTPACNQAIIYIRIDLDDGRFATIRLSLLLCRSMEWKIAAFFQCIGEKKPGEKCVMNWNRVAGSRGRAHIIQRKYTDKDGEIHTVNDVDKFIDYDPKNFAGVPANLKEDPDNGGDIPF